MNKHTRTRQSNIVDIYHVIKKKMKMTVFASSAIYCSKSYFFLVIQNFAAIIVQAGKSCHRLRIKVKVNTLLEKWVLQNSAFYFQFSIWQITLNSPGWSVFCPCLNGICGFWSTRILHYFHFPPSSSSAVTGVISQISSIIWRQWKPYIFWMHII